MLSQVQLSEFWKQRFFENFTSEN